MVRELGARFCFEPDGLKLSQHTGVQGHEPAPASEGDNAKSRTPFCGPSKEAVSKW